MLSERRRFLKLSKIMDFVKRFSHVAYQFVTWVSFRTPFHVICFFYFLYEHHNTSNNKFLQATLTFVRNQDFLAHMKLSNNFSLPSGQAWLPERWLPRDSLALWANYYPVTKWRVCSMQLACLWKESDCYHYFKDWRSLFNRQKSYYHWKLKRNKAYAKLLLLEHYVFKHSQGRRKGWKGTLVLSGFKKFQQKKVVFLVSSEKKQISPLLLLPWKNFGKSPGVPLEKIFPTPMYTSTLFCS